MENNFYIEGLSAEEFNQILKYGKTSNVIGQYESKKFIELPYGIVKRELPILQKGSKFQEMILAVLNCQFENVNIDNVSGNDLMAFLLWIKQQLEFIYSIELKYLSTDPDLKMMAAGLHKLNELGELPIIDQLAKGDILKYDLIEALPYFKVYEKLKLDKINSEISKAYEEIIKKQ